MKKFACIMWTTLGFAIFTSAGGAQAFTYGRWRSGMTIEEANQALADEHQTVRFRGSVSNLDSLVTVSGDALYFCHGALIAFSRNIPDKDQAFSILEEMKKVGKPKVEEDHSPVFGKPWQTYRYEWTNDEVFTGVDIHSIKTINIDEIGSADELASSVDLTKEGFRKVWWKLMKCEPK